MKKHYETHVEDTDKLISVAGPVLDYKSLYEQYRKLMEEQAQRKYGLYTPTSEGDDDDFPSIPGMIARYSASGLTNEHMKENPVWVDKTGNGHDLQMKNFIWGGMSGVGGYVDNWNSSADWAINSYWVNSHTDHKLQFITASSVVQARSNNIYNAENVYKNILNVNGLTEAVNKGSVKALRIIATDPITSKAIKTFSFETNGVIQISFDDVLQDYYVVYFLSGNNTNDIDITIEQLPLYPGALVFDGVDDYGICENFPILTKEKGYTVVALRKWLTPENKTNNEVLVANLKEPRWETEAWGAWGAFGCEIKYNNTNPKIVRTLSFGQMPVINVNENNVLLCQTSNNYNGVDITSGNDTGGPYLLICSRGGSLFANAAIWELIILDHDATEEELAKIKDYFVKTYPWLFPDQAWTVVGKTNEDEDRATIANITGNGNDLILSNFGFIEGSGYNEEGEYAGYLVTDGVDDKAVSKQFKFGENFTVILDFKFPVKKISYCGFDLSSKVRIQNLQGSGVYVVLKGNKTLIPSNVVRAVTSEGKVYDENWNEYNIVPGNISSNYTMVNLGFDGSNQFAESATKLAGIYSSTLSKDDCIKAYNYLQTLKSK